MPAVQALHLAELVQRWGVSRAALLGDLGVSERELADPSTKLPVRELVPLVERARRLTGEPGLGIYFGVRMQVVSHGYLGFAAMTAGTVGEAIELAVRFAPLLTNAVSLSVRRGARSVAVVVEEEAPLGPARDAVLLAILVGIWRIGCTLTGRELEGRADLAIPEPPYFDRFRSIARPVRFSQPKNQLVFDPEVLGYRLATADPAALELARAQCERSLEQLGYGGRTLSVARAAVLRPQGGSRTLEEVAAKLRVSGRTLKRRLAAAGTTYSALLHEARLERARELLAQGERSIEQVADALGYSDTANFTRAFRRWTRTTPAAYRRRSASGRGDDEG